MRPYFFSIVFGAALFSHAAFAGPTGQREPVQQRGQIKTLTAGRLAIRSPITIEAGEDWNNLIFQNGAKTRGNDVNRNYKSCYLTPPVVKTEQYTITYNNGSVSNRTRPITKANYKRIILPKSDLKYRWSGDTWRQHTSFVADVDVLHIFDDNHIETRQEQIKITCEFGFKDGPKAQLPMTDHDYPNTDDVEKCFGQYVHMQCIWQNLFFEPFRDEVCADSNGKKVTYLSDVDTKSVNGNGAVQEQEQRAVARTLGRAAK